MERWSWRGPVITSITVILVSCGCGDGMQPMFARHLGDSLLEWRSAYLPPRVSLSLDDRWEEVPSREGLDGRLFSAKLPDPISSIDNVLEATARLNGRIHPLELFGEGSPVQKDVYYVEPGERTFKWLRAPLRTNGSATCTVELRQGPAEFTVYAKGQPAAGEPPEMVVLLNGEAIARFDVTARGEHEPYVASGMGKEGVNTLEVEFTNDLVRPPENRSLHAREVEVLQTGRVFTLAGAGETPPAGMEIEYLPLPHLARDYRRLEPAPGLSDGGGRWRYYEVGRETRPAIPFAPPGEARFSVRLGRTDSINVAFAAIVSTTEATKRPIQFEAFIEQDGKRFRADSVEAAPSMSRKKGSWVHRTFALDGHSAGPAELVLTSRMKSVGNGVAAHGGEEAIVLLSEPVLSTPSPRSRAARNVILVSLDTLRADHLGCYGYERATSPVLDDFAAGNVLFETVIAQSSWTLPSHASMLGSLYGSAHGAMRQRDSIRNVEMLASVLKREGYHTKAVADGVLMAPSYGFSIGFDSYEDHAHRGFRAILPVAKRWLRDFSEEPFFLFIHTYDVHSPYHPPARFRDRFPPPKGTSPKLVNGHATHRLPERETSQQRAADLQHVINMYDAGIMYVDEQMGNLFDLLEELGQWDNTLVIVTSDHGEEFKEHGGMSHGHTLFEEVLRVPLLLHVPGIQEATRIARAVQLIDIPPTVVGFLGIEPGKDFQGESLLRYLGATAPAPRAAYAETMSSISRTYKGEKLIHDFKSGRSALYNLANDPGEKKNLAGRRKRRTRSLIEELNRFREANTALLGRKTSQETRMTDELAEQLRQLGYMD